MPALVLTYHAMNVDGRTHADNDHVALAQDLRALHGAGVRVARVHELAAAALGEAPMPRDPVVAITFDDGSWFDWHDLEHPTHGPQRAFAGILRDFAAESGAFVHATSFVIVSPRARAVLDRSCMVGAGWWGDDWWREAEAEGLLAIESHSWDHNHETLPAGLRADPRGGRFDHVGDPTEADAQVAQASAWLDAHVGARRPRVLAWPYGQSTPYLRDEWMPRHAAGLGILAAFGTRPAPLRTGAPRWDLPRYVCGRDWRSIDELLRLII